MPSTPQLKLATGRAAARGSETADTLRTRADRQLELLQRLMAFSRKLSTNFEGRPQPLATTESRRLALQVLSDSPEGLSQAGLAAAIDRSAPLVTRIVDELEAAGLVERQSHAFDRRLKLLHLTDLGRSRGVELTAGIRGFGADLFADETDADMATFDRILRRLNAKLAAGLGHEDDAA